MLRFDWRRVVVYTHRWLGIAGSLLFIAWFVSGIVMMYARMPSLTAEERLMRLPRLDLSRARVSLSDAAETAMETPPTRVRIGMHGDRPVYRMLSGRKWTTVYADTGEVAPAAGAGDALATVLRFSPEHAATIHYDAYLRDSDQWTLSSEIRALMPLHRLALGDAAGSYVYISEQTGEPVMKTTAPERRWNYVGAVLHWVYFTPFRRHATLWAQTIIYLSLAGAVMCLLGLAWGVWRYSPGSRFRLKRAHSHSPYAGFMKWHHYAGLLFGVVTFTWIFSGLLSMDPWDWHPGNSPTRQQQDAVAGGRMRLDRITVTSLRNAITVLSRTFVPKELELVQFRGEPYLSAYRPPSASEDYEWSNTDLASYLTPASRLDHLLVSAVAPERGAFERFGEEALTAAAVAAMPGVPMDDVVWLTAYDSYYYDRRGAQPLPVVRVRYRDPQQTWLYLDPGRGVIALKEERLSRVNRWLYHGLHSLDFPGLYYKRPLWDVVVIALSTGGLVLSATTLVPAWRRLRRHARRLGLTGTRNQRRLKD